MNINNKQFNSVKSSVSLLFTVLYVDKMKYNRATHYRHNYQKSSNYLHNAVYHGNCCINDADSGNVKTDVDFVSVDKSLIGKW